MKKPNSPPRILRYKTWYFCLVISMISVCAVYAQTDSSLQLSPTVQIEAPDIGHVATSRHHKKRFKDVITAHRRMHRPEAVTNLVAPGDNQAVLATSAPSTPVTMEPAAPTAAIAPPVVTKPTPQPVAAPATPLEMTRDSAPAAQPVHDAGKLDVTGQIVRMLGSLLLVLLLILGSVKLLRRYNLIPQGTQNGAPTGLMQFARPQPIPWIATAQPVPSVPPATAPPLPSGSHGAGLDSASFKLLSSLNLPGSTSSVYLVQASHRLLVLGSSQSTGLSLITEIAAAEPAAPKAAGAAVPKTAHEPETAYVDSQADDDDDALLAFADILREKAGLPTTSDRADQRVIDQIDSRLSATQERLEARLKAAAEHSAIIAATPTKVPRRRATKTASNLGRDV